MLPRLTDSCRGHTVDRLGWEGVSHDRSGRRAAPGPSARRDRPSSGLPDRRRKKSCSRQLLGMTQQSSASACPLAEASTELMRRDAPRRLADKPPHVAADGQRTRGGTKGRPHCANGCAAGDNNNLAKIEHFGWSGLVIQSHHGRRVQKAACSDVSQILHTRC